MVEQATVRSCPTCRAIYRTDFERCPSDGSLLSLGDADPLIGSVIAKHYVIDALLGEGGMGRVYRAHHTLLQHRQVAIKVLLGDLAATIAMRLRFGQEAELASRLDHPNVVSVIDYGTDERLLFLVMELVAGRTLGELIAREAPLAPRRAIALTRQLCRGLAHAHDRGLIHRDFKPDNVIVGFGNEHAVITDFGIAISRDEDASASRLTTAGIALGTPSYAAPEQTHRGAVDHRADLFALGVTLYEMLAGRLPFDGDAMQVVLRNASEAPPSIELRSGVRIPAALELVVRQLMARRPDDRFASARDVLDALDAVEAQESSAPPPSAGRARPSSNRATRVALVAAIAAVVGGVILMPDGENTQVQHAQGEQALDKLDRVHVGELDEARQLDRGQQVHQPDQVQQDHQLDQVQQVDEVVVGKLDVARAAATLAVRREPTESVSIDRRRIRPTRPTTRIPSANRQMIVEDQAPPVEVSTSIAVVDAPPLPPPAPPAPTPAPAPAPTPAPFVARASVQFTALRVRGSLSESVIVRALARTRPRLRACFASAATSSKRSPAAVVHLAFSVDDTRQPAAIKMTSSWPELERCVRDVIGGLRTETAPDVGDVPVSVDVTFQPETT